MALSKDEIKKIAELARLKLNEEEVELYSKQLSGILSYIDQLSEVNTDNVEPTAQITGLENSLRVDEVIEWNKEEREAAINQVPAVEINQIKVKRVLL